MADTSLESVVEGHGAPASPSSPPNRPTPFNERPAKLGNRERLLGRLHRISSSQSVARLGKPRSRTYSGSGKGSVSCISLGSGATPYSSAFDTSLTGDSAASYSTAPTSNVSTPGGIQIPTFDERARLRHLSNLDGKSSAAVPLDLRPSTKSGQTPNIVEGDEDYFSRPITHRSESKRDFSFWRDMPSEIKMEILTYLKPKEIVRCSAVSHSWHKMCFDGQLWAILDTTDFYREIPADALVNIITSAGPFVRDLNLRGCVQLRERWHAKGLSDACRNLQNFNLEGCRIDRSSIHNFLYQNNRLLHINLSGLAGATNAGMKVLATHCPMLEHLNVSWCNNIDTRGLGWVVDGCNNLRDLRAGEIRGWDDKEFAQKVFEKNKLERLILTNCDSLTDESLAVLFEGTGSEIDYLTGRPIVPPRNLKHLDLTRCRGISDQGMRSFVNNIPHIEGLQLAKCSNVFDASLTDLLPTTPMLTHLDLEELEDLTNAVLHCLSNSPCAKRLRHLSISYCENMGDTGMIPLLKSCTNLRSLEMDNTRISDLVLTEAASMLRSRSSRSSVHGKPTIGLRLVAYDCQNVTWTGVREVLSRNAEVFTSTVATELPPLEKNLPSTSTSSTHLTIPHPGPRIHVLQTSSYPSTLLSLKCFYSYQPTVDEHTKRCLRGEFAAARRLERKWADFMIAQEEAGAGGAGVRRRRRRAREAAMGYADEEEVEGSGAVGGVGGGRRRRARSGGCGVM
ncbi:hypothetical protein MBLNU230_g0381t1 [Neophaeotheca triangularis]